MCVYHMSTADSMVYVLVYKAVYVYTCMYTSVCTIWQQLTGICISIYSMYVSVYHLAAADRCPSLSSAAAQDT